MRPFLFNIGDFYIPSFFFLIMVGTLAMTFYCFFIAGRVGLRRELTLDLAIVCLIAGVLGSRLFHILVEAPGYYWENPAHLLDFWRGGFTSFGTVIAIPLAAVLYLRLRKVPVWPYLDLMAIGAPLLQFTIRGSCLLAGCCFGKPTDLPWGITFTDPASVAYYFYPNVALHPTQLYSMLHAVFLFIFVNLYYFKKRDRVPGEVLSITFLGYFIPRGIIEIWRADADRGLWLGDLLSTGQVVSIIGMGGAIILLLYLRRRAAQKRP